MKLRAQISSGKGVLSGIERTNRIEKIKQVVTNFLRIIKIVLMFFHLSNNFGILHSFDRIDTVSGIIEKSFHL